MKEELSERTYDKGMREKEREKNKRETMRE
jgi:hypothetical protein